MNDDKQFIGLVQSIFTGMVSEDAFVLHSLYLIPAQTFRGYLSYKIITHF